MVAIRKSKRASRSNKKRKSVRKSQRRQSIKRRSSIRRRYGKIRGGRIDNYSNCVDDNIYNDYGLLKKLNEELKIFRDGINLLFQNTNNQDKNEEFKKIEEDIKNKNIGISLTDMITKFKINHFMDIINARDCLLNTTTNKTNSITLDDYIINKKNIKDPKDIKIYKNTDKNITKDFIEYKNKKVKNLKNESLTLKDMSCSLNNFINTYNNTIDSIDNNTNIKIDKEDILDSLINKIDERIKNV